MDVGQGRFYLMENIKAWLYHCRIDSLNGKVDDQVREMPEGHQRP